MLSGVHVCVLLFFSPPRILLGNAPIMYPMHGYMQRFGGANRDSGVEMTRGAMNHFIEKEAGWFGDGWWGKEGLWILRSRHVMPCYVMSCPLHRISLITATWYGLMWMAW